jgi:hypothetical protein
MPQLAIGVLSGPANRRNRDGARATWLRSNSVRDGRVIAKFVLRTCGKMTSRDEYAKRLVYTYAAAATFVTGVACVFAAFILCIM